MSPHEPPLLAWLGLAHWGLAWPGPGLEAGPCTTLTTTLSVLKNITYETLIFMLKGIMKVFVQDFIIIIFEAISLGTAYSGTALTACLGFSLHDSAVSSALIISAWVLDITLNGISGEWVGKRLL
ncbi:hypothetical protein HD554DRAFT_2035196 [Boletus coccyginus]|nr:hypothetical protein HD554DRAFT_2035196 [Boletus coccyginus]